MFAWAVVTASEGISLAVNCSHVCVGGGEDLAAIRQEPQLFPCLRGRWEITIIVNGRPKNCSMFVWAVGHHGCQPQYARTVGLPTRPPKVDQAFMVGTSGIPSLFLNMITRIYTCDCCKEQVSYPYGGYRLTFSGDGGIGFVFLDNLLFQNSKDFIICKSCVVGLRYALDCLPLDCLPKPFDE